MWDPGTAGGRLRSSRVSCIKWLSNLTAQVPLFEPILLHAATAPKDFLSAHCIPSLVGLQHAVPVFRLRPLPPFERLADLLERRRAVLLAHLLLTQRWDRFWIY